MEDQSPDISRATEKNSEQMKQELVDAILEQNRQLEGQLVTEVSIGEEEKVYIFNAFPSNGSSLELCTGISSKDGPVLFSKDTSRKLADMRSRDEQLQPSYVRAGRIPVSADSMKFWQEGFNTATQVATRKVERIRNERTVLPKALEFVKSQGIRTETVVSQPGSDTSVGADLIRPSE